MVTKAVGLALDESVASLKSMTKSVKKAKSSINKLKKVTQIINIAAAAVWPRSRHCLQRSRFHRQKRQARAGA